MYDQSCYDLAESFLEDEPQIDTEENRKELAGEIQKTIEDFIGEKKGADKGQFAKEGRR